MPRVLPSPGRWITCCWPCRRVWRCRRWPSILRCHRPWPASGAQPLPGWRRMRSTLPCTRRRSGANTVCPAKRAAGADRWRKSTTPRCPAPARRCSASSACRRSCARRLAKMRCARIAARSWCGCSVKKQENRSRNASRTGAADPFTAAANDLHAGDGHGQAPAAGPDAGPWAGRLAGIGSEWSPQFPGYLAGAIEAAEAGVAAVLARGPRRAA